MDLLTDSERQYIEQDDQRKRAVAVGRLSELALTMQNTEQVINALRETDVETARKIGKAAREVMTLLERLSIAEVASEEHAPLADSEELPRAEEAVPEVHDEERVVQQPVEVEAPVAELEPETKAEADTDSEPETSRNEEDLEALIPESAERWIQQVIGDKWREKIGAEDDDSVEELAEKILNGIRVRKNKGEPADMHKTRLVGLLRGLSPKEIAETEGWGTPSAIGQFERSLKKRLGKKRPDDSLTPDVVILPTTSAASQQTVTHQQLEVTEPINKEHAQEEQAPRYVRFTELLEQQLGLTSTERVSLVSFFDPKSRGEMNATKQATLEKVVEYIQPRFESPEYQLTPEELKWVRTCLGIFSVNGTQTGPLPVPVIELRRRVRDKAQADRVEQAVFSGIEKLLVEPRADMKELFASDFIRAALVPKSIDAERFSELRRELEMLLEKRFDESVAREISRAIEENINPTRGTGTSDELRDAFAKIRQLIGLSGLETSGNADIDKALRRFVSVSRGGSIAIEEGEEELQLHQRRVVAGLYIYLQVDGGER